VNRLFANREARIYLAAQCLSLIGDNALWLALGIWVKILTGSNSDAGLTFFAYLLGLLLGPVGGVVADRVRRRPLLIVTNLVAGVGVCALLLVSGRGQLWLIYLVLFGYGAVSGLITSAQNALLTVMLPDDLLGEANSLLQVGEIGLRIITPLIGAGILAVAGAKPVILLDAFTFLVAGLALFLLRVREPRVTPSGESWLAEMSAGMWHLRRTPALWHLQISLVGAQLVFGFFQVAEFAIVSQGLNRTPPFLGILETAMGAGAVFGGLVAARLMRWSSERAMVVFSLAGAAIVCPLLMTKWLPVVLVAMTAAGICIVWVEVAAITLVQRRTPKELIGRVTAAIMTMAMIPQAISFGLGSALIAIVNYRLLLAVMAIVFLASAVQMAAPNREVTDRSADLAEVSAGEMEGEA
jgi:MFS family permease